MTMESRKAAWEALIKIFLMGMFWSACLWSLEHLPFNWTRTASQYAFASIEQEPVFLLVVATAVLAVVFGVVTAVIIWHAVRRRTEHRDSTVRYACEILADLADSVGCAIALLMFAFLTSVLNPSQPSMDLPMVIGGSIAFLVLSYGLLFVGKRYSA